MIIVFFLLVLLPIVFSSATVSAQSSSYTVDKVDHSIEVMYSGQVVVRETIHVSGQVTGGFMIGLPAKYSSDVLKTVAYDSSNVYQVNSGVHLGDRIGFYGVEINFNGNSPSVFTVAFILSSGVVSYDSNAGTYTLDFPAYPSVIQDVSTCNVTVTFPSSPTSIVITKSDGQVNGDNYVTQTLAAYTYSIGSAVVKISTGTLQLTNIDNLNRQINIDPTGKVSASDNYHLTNNATTTMTSFILNLPNTASNIVVKDEFGRSLTASTSTSSAREVLLANATLVTFLTSGQSASITVNYNLPSATIQGSQYVLSNFKLFPDFYYYVEHAILTFTPPEGATILTPELSSLDASSTVTRSTFQDSLTVGRNGVSYVDYVLPKGNNIQFSYDYNPVWVSFRPTFWGSLLGVILCVGAVFYRRSKPGEKELATTRTERLTPKTTSGTVSYQSEEFGPVTTQRVTSENLREFSEAYEEKKQLNSELKSMDSRAQKGKIPRRQYKVQRRAIEIRLETLTRNINKLKDALRNSSSAYADLVKQLDSAEEELLDAEENIKKLESGQSTGEISLETYKKNIGEYQKRKDKSESTLNGILLRLREKSR
jgi:predicted  nucleic acid-binding Zn-ribbon protein